MRMKRAGIYSSIIDDIDRAVTYGEYDDVFTDDAQYGELSYGINIYADDYDGEFDKDFMVYVDVFIDPRYLEASYKITVMDMDGTVFNETKYYGTVEQALDALNEIV